MRTVPQSNSCRHGSTSRNLGSDECDVETDRQTTPRLDRSHGAAHSSVAAPTSLASEDAEGSASVPTASLLGPVTRCRCRMRPSPRPGRTSTRTSTQQRDRVLRRVRCTERCAPGCGERPEKRNSHNDCHHVPERLSPTPETDDHQICRHDSIQRCCGRVDLPESARTGLPDRHTHLPGLAQSPTCRSPCQGGCTAYVSTIAWLTNLCEQSSWTCDMAPSTLSSLPATKLLSADARNSALAAAASCRRASRRYARRRVVGHPSGSARRHLRWR